MIQKEKPSFLHMRWSEADDALLKELVLKGCNATQISEVLGRTRSAIFGRKLLLGIPGKIKRTGACLRKIDAAIGDRYYFLGSLLKKIRRLEAARYFFISLFYGISRLKFKALLLAIFQKD